MNELQQYVKCYIGKEKRNCILVFTVQPSILPTLYSSQMTVTLTRTMLYLLVCQKTSAKVYRMGSCPSSMNAAADL